MIRWLRLIRRHSRAAQRPARAHPQPAATAPDGGTLPGGVRGERGRTVASGVRSLQSRLNGLLAVGLAIGVGIAMLAWYYAQTMHRPQRRTLAAQRTAQGAGRMSLPPLGPLGRVRVESLPRVHAAPTTPLARLRGSAAASTVRPAAFGSALPRAPQAPGARSLTGAPGHGALARRLSGGVFARIGGGSDGASALGSRTAGGASSAAAADALEGVRERSGSDALGRLLRPTVLRATRAELLPQQRLLLAQGTFIDCTLETAIDSTLPGMTTCVTASDTFSADGTVVLLPRGTQLIGETRGQVRQGMARVFVIWSEARTPSGVVVRLDSPGTDALGRSGLTGRVERHFWQRFGAALLVSTIGAVVQSRLQSGTGTVVVDPTLSENVLTEALRGTVNIPPTVVVPNGARIEVLVARDVDFRSVYELVARR